MKNLLINMKPQTCKPQNVLQTTNVIYKFQCKHESCKLHDSNCYIGHTSTTLSRRLTMHLQQGAIADHYNTVHETKLDRKTLVDSTTILYRI